MIVSGANRPPTFNNAKSFAASTFTTVVLLRNSPDLVALLPRDVCEFFKAHKLLKILPITLTSRTQPFGIVTRASGTLTGVAQRFTEMLRPVA